MGIFNKIRDCYLKHKLSFMAASIAGATLPNATAAAEEAFFNKPKVDFVQASSYYDTRGMGTVGIESKISNLPLDLKLFGFVDAYTQKDEIDDFQEPYSELRLFRLFKYNIGPAIEYNGDLEVFNDEFDLKDDTLRYGIIFEPDIFNKKMFLGLKWFPNSTKEQGHQLGVYAKKNFMDGDLYISGFLDYNVKPKKNSN